MDKNINLVKLYLYCNEIEKIENLDHLKNLEILWLHKNKINNIEGLDNLKMLMDLNLAENKINKIGDKFMHLNHLKILELSGNAIYSFKVSIHYRYNIIL